MGRGLGGRVGDANAQVCLLGEGELGGMLKSYLAIKLKTVRIKQKLFAKEKQVTIKTQEYIDNYTTSKAAIKNSSL